MTEGKRPIYWAIVIIVTALFVSTIQTFVLGPEPDDTLRRLITNGALYTAGLGIALLVADFVTRRLPKS